MVLPSRCYERFSRLLPGIAWLDVSAANIGIKSNLMGVYPGQIRGIFDYAIKGEI
ncbi:MAG: hypothetical protein F6K39_12365 [Okeania sp. SIO3B3]|nr:hypothetical protein [Okeania sp. SIO3B3]